MASRDVSVLQAQESATVHLLQYIDVLSALRQAEVPEDGMPHVLIISSTRTDAVQTMTQATTEHHLSKLDLFTPNVLHPTLPPLTSGLHTVMGSGCTMILEADVLAREAHIKSLLGDHAEKHMQRRPAAHDRIIAHMGIYYCSGNGSGPGGWRRAPGLSEAALEKAAKSMKTQEGRNEYVNKNLEKEWKAMGMGSGNSRDEALEID
jgi:hypothetical protein